MRSRRWWGEPVLSLGPPGPTLCPFHSAPAPGGWSFWGAWLGFLALWLLIGCSQWETPAGDWKAGGGRGWCGNWGKALRPQSVTQISCLPSSPRVFPLGMSSIPWVRTGLANRLTPASSRHCSPTQEWPWKIVTKGVPLHEPNYGQFIFAFLFKMVFKGNVCLSLSLKTAIRKSQEF